MVHWSETLGTFIPRSSEVDVESGVRVRFHQKMASPGGAHMPHVQVGRAWDPSRNHPHNSLPLHGSRLNTPWHPETLNPKTQTPTKP